MTWFSWLALVAIITALAAVTGIQPKGAEQLAHTRMMKSARIALLISVVMMGVAYVLGRGHVHG